jgi:hypothetical protein
MPTNAARLFLWVLPEHARGSTHHADGTSQQTVGISLSCASTSHFYLSSLETLTHKQSFSSSLALGVAVLFPT